MPKAPTRAQEGDVDVAIVGAGILGLAVARELLGREPGRRVVVLEREGRIAAHQTSHTSGVIHAGIYYEPGSLKARLCVRGAALLKDWCAERGVPVREDGKLIVAADGRELARLDELERRGRENGVPGLRRVGPDEIAEIEPAARGVAALHSPGTAVTDFAAVAEGLAAEVSDLGGEIRTGTPVVEVDPEGGGVVVASGGAGIGVGSEGGGVEGGGVGVAGERGGARGGRRAGGGPAGGRRGGSIRGGTRRIAARLVLTCAGAWSDRLARGAGAPAEPRIVPFRGAYARLEPGVAGEVRGSVYPVPDPALPFLGAHLTRTIGGEVLLGPTALMVGARDAYRLGRVRARDLAETLGWPGTWRLALQQRRAAIRELRHAASRSALAAEASRLVPAVTAESLRPGPAGVRAQALGRDGRLVDDFVVHRTPGALHIRNAPSPAATSCLALAELIADEAERMPR